MPVHDVTMNLSHPITVKNVDVEFEVRSDGELQGKVQISKGGIDWTPFKSHPDGDLGAVRRMDGGIRLKRIPSIGVVPLRQLHGVDLRTSAATCQARAPAASHVRSMTAG